MKRIAYGVKVLFTALAVLVIISSYYFVMAEGWSGVDAFYFTVSTITTVGYGDIVPTTPATKIVTSFIAFIGIAMVLTLFGMLSSHYVRIVNERERKIHKKFEEDEAKQEKEIKKLKTKVEKVKKAVK